jgi:hypothetical protein
MVRVAVEALDAHLRVIALDRVSRFDHQVRCCLIAVALDAVIAEAGSATNFFTIILQSVLPCGKEVEIARLLVLLLLL